MKRRTYRTVLLLPLLLASCASSAGEPQPVPSLTPGHFAAADRPAPAPVAPHPAPRDPGPAARAGGGPEQSIDLPGALQLAGAGSLAIEFARERVAEAQASRAGADVLWIPDLFIGARYDRHEGADQSTPGFIIEADKQSAFVGGGLIASFELADVFFEPGVASRELRAQESALTGTTNDVLLQVALTYHDLLEAQYELAIARESVATTEELAGLAGSFARTGQGLEADAARVQSDLFRHKRAGVAAEARIAVRSARLATLLRLDPTVRLRAAESGLVPVPLIPEEVPVGELVEQAQISRPEVEQLIAVVDAAERREEQERLRPLIPNLVVGLSGGGLGGGRGSTFDSLAGNGDFRIGVVWSLDNLGLGNRASADRRGAQYRQARVALARFRDQISQEVTVAYQEVHNERRQMDFAVKGVEEAQRSLELNMARIRAAQGLPIEALQAIQAALTAQRAYLEATMDYNRAQLRLLRAVGRPPGAG